MRASGLGTTQTAILADLVEIILPEYPEMAPATQASVHADVTQYVATQIQSMPGFLRLPYRLALIGFDLLPLLRYGRPFRRLPRPAKLAYMGMWNDGPLGVLRDFVKLIRSLALFVYFDHALVMQSLEVERAA